MSSNHLTITYDPQWQKLVTSLLNPNRVREYMCTLRGGSNATFSYVEIYSCTQPSTSNVMLLPNTYVPLDTPQATVCPPTESPVGNSNSEDVQQTAHFTSAEIDPLLTVIGSSEEDELDEPKHLSRAIKRSDMSGKDFQSQVMDILYALQQLSCKELAKSLVHTAYPAKRSSYPYKAGEKAKPPIWPADVRHKEPDHLRKFERTKLLVCFLEKLPASASIHAIQATKRKVSPSRYDYLDELTRLVREHCI